jgi:hypothetical protein
MRKTMNTLAFGMAVGALALAPVAAVAQDAATTTPVPFTSAWESERWIGDDGEAILLRIEGSSDPRMDGAAMIVWNDTEYADADGSGEYLLSSSTVRIENDGGAWQGSALDFSGTADLYGGELQTIPTTVLVGEGSYDGLIAVVMEVDGWADVKGVILPAPAPEPPAAQAPRP